MESAQNFVQYLPKLLLKHYKYTAKQGNSSQLVSL